MRQEIGMWVAAYIVGHIICWGLVIRHRRRDDPGEDIISCMGMAWMVSLAWPILAIGYALLRLGRGKKGLA